MNSPPFITPPRILAHNLLRSIVGMDGSAPIIQPAILAAGECEVDTLNFLHRFARIHTTQPWENCSLDYLVSHLAAEFSTILAVARHVAYYATPFNAQNFADSLQDPNIWLGQSYYRIGNLIINSNSNHSPNWIQSSIRVLAATEALEVQSALAQCMGIYTLVDLDIFNRESGEDSHDSM